MRIYALAKELDLDSKDLVAICQKAGIPGKGSALASLTEDEVQKVRVFLSGGKERSAPAPAPIPAPTPAPAPVPASAPVEVARREAPPVPSAPPTPAPAAAVSRAAFTREAAPIRGKIRVLDVGTRRQSATAPPQDTQLADKEFPEAGKSAPPKKRREPVIKLAEIPEAKQPPAKAKVEEVRAQKPDIRLPKDAIVRTKAGEAGPLESITRALEKPRKLDERKKEKSDKPPAPATEAPLRGKTGGKRRPAEEVEAESRPGTGLAGMASARADRQKSRKTRSRTREEGGGGESEDRPTPAARKPRTLIRRRNINTAAPRKEQVILELPCTVRSFSAATGVGSGQVFRVLMGMGIGSANINSQLDDETAGLLATELGVEIELKQPASLEDTLLDGFQETDVDPAELEPRPPVVTFLGHVDHGKTSLLDRIIGTNVVAGEAGGITQHIRAYQISKDGRKISFVDTPGHEAFTEMRARGANVTDIAVLVIAADDGVMPQTEEAISHARAAEVPIVVALNKVDLPGADANRVLQQLAAQNILPSEWGGDVEVIRTSAATGAGINDLLETILLTAEMHEHRAKPRGPAVGVCLEAAQEAGRGVIAKLIVKSGSLSVGDIVLCGSAYGRVKAMFDTLKTTKRLKSAGPSTPANVTGFDHAPEAGQRFYVLEDISQARELAEQRSNRSRQRSLAGGTTRVSFEEFQRRLAGGNLTDTRERGTLNLVVRADTRGSIEAIEKELTKLEHPEVQIKILHRAVGSITAADIMLAYASQAVVIGFSVIPDEAARALAEEKHVEIRRYDIIYKVTDDVRATLEGKLKPDQKVVELGHAIVKQVFPISRVGSVAGCYVVRGSIQRNCRIRVNRDGRTIGEYDLESLRREKDDVKEVARGMECGIKLSGFNDIKQDDILEAYQVEEVARTL